MLYIIATPIGNLEDVTLRALRHLREADCILAEDTRRARILLKRYGIFAKKLLSFYEHNEERRLPQIISLLKEGKTVALISNSGVPLISDPGYKLVKKCIEEEIPFTSLPGPSSLINALVLSGISPVRFLFLGFLPRRQGRLKRELDFIKNLPFTLVIFESCQRIKKTLLILEETLGDRRASLLREMTKFYEEVIRGCLSQIRESLGEKKIKGELVLVVEGKTSV